MRRRSRLSRLFGHLEAHEGHGGTWFPTSCHCPNCRAPSKCQRLAVEGRCKVTIAFRSNLLIHRGIRGVRCV